jgi:hypothetical protein
MEKTFIRILNKTLLIGCLILLSGAILLAALSAYNFSMSFPDNSPQKAITVPITTITQARGAVQQAALNNNASNPGAPQIDPQLLTTAHQLCAARSRFVIAVTNGGLSIKDLSACAQGAAQDATTAFGNRASNVLAEETRHFQVLADDPGAKTLTPARDADTGFPA